MSPAFFAAALAHRLRGDEDEYATWTELGNFIALVQGPSSCSVCFGCRAALHKGEVDQARTLATASRVCSNGYYEPYAEAILAETAVIAGSDDAEEQLATAQRLAPENDFVAAQLLRAEGRLRHDETALKDSVTGWQAIGARFERACTLLLLPDRIGEGSAELTALGCIPPAPVWLAL
jgi:hypothetical protein